MRFHVQRAIDIWGSQGSLALTKKVARYLPIAIDNVFYRSRQARPTKVMEEDWDTLVILDACRFDMVEGRVDVPGDLAHRISLGSTSEEFLARNFDGGKFYDTVYVNANPYLPHLDLDSETFHHVVDLLSEWDEESQTVLPEVVTESAIETHRRFPQKRLIVHYMQPHIPFIGNVGRELEMGGWSPDASNQRIEGETIWQHLRAHPPGAEGGLDIDVVWEAYNENLEIVLDQVRKFIGEADGLTVVTSDHGNMLGERLGPIPTRRMYGHPLGVYHPCLVKVPWLRVESGSRRDVVEEPPRNAESPDEEDVESKLRALGYR